MECTKFKEYLRSYCPNIYIGEYFVSNTKVYLMDLRLKVEFPKSLMIVLFCKGPSMNYFSKEVGGPKKRLKNLT